MCGACSSLTHMLPDCLQLQEQIMCSNTVTSKKSLVHVLFLTSGHKNEVLA